jgi:hypothetical protein
MILATIAPDTARLLQRVRWLAWGAIAAVLAIHFAAAFVQPSEPQILLPEQVAAHPGAACGCAHNPETI